jgi:hypothetical protein
LVLSELGSEAERAAHAAEVQRLRGRGPLVQHQGRTSRESLCCDNQLQPEFLAEFIFSDREKFQHSEKLSPVFFLSYHPIYTLVRFDLASHQLHSPQT